MIPRVLCAAALILTFAGLGLCLPFSTCPGCHGKGELRVPPSHFNHEKYTQACLDCRGTGRTSFITTRRVLSELVPCRLCNGHGIQAECSFYTGPGRPCETCDGSGKMSPQKVRQYDQETQDTVRRLSGN